MRRLATGSALWPAMIRSAAACARARPRPPSCSALLKSPIAAVLAPGDLRERRPRELALLAEEPRRRAVLLGDRGIGLPALALVDEPEQQKRNGEHRNDHDEDEEQRQAIAKAHVWSAYRRPGAIPAPLDAWECR